LEEKITIGEGSHDPREQTGEAGDRRFSVARGAGRATENLLEFDSSVKLIHLSTKVGSQRP